MLRFLLLKDAAVAVAHNSRAESRNRACTYYELRRVRWKDIGKRTLNLWLLGKCPQVVIISQVLQYKTRGCTGSDFSGFGSGNTEFHFRVSGNISGSDF